MRVRIWLLAFSKFLDLRRPDFKVLLGAVSNGSVFLGLDPLTLGVRLFSSSSADMCFSVLGGAAAAFSLFFSSL